VAAFREPVGARQPSYEEVKIRDDQVDRRPLSSSARNIRLSLDTTNSIVSSASSMACMSSASCGLSSSWRIRSRFLMKKSVFIRLFCGAPELFGRAQGRRVAWVRSHDTVHNGFTISLTNSHRARTHASTGMTNCEASLVNEGMALEKGAFSHMSMVINPTPD